MGAITNPKGNNLVTLVGKDSFNSTKLLTLKGRLIHRTSIILKLSVYQKSPLNSLKGQITQQENMQAIPIADKDTDSGLYYECL